MQYELVEFERNKVRKLVPKPDDLSVIGLKWIFKNNTDKEGNVLRNKARLVVKGYSQQEGIDYAEAIAPMARLEVFFEYFLLMHHTKTLMFIRSMSSAFFLMES